MRAVAGAIVPNTRKNTTMPAKVGRPKIPTLHPLNVRLPRKHVDALDALVLAEQKRRSDPGFNRTDAMREAVSAYIDAKRPDVW